jgi:hypothetical protein
MFETTNQIKWAIFNSKLLNYQRVNQLETPHQTVAFPGTPSLTPQGNSVVQQPPEVEGIGFGEKPRNLR